MTTPIRVADFIAQTLAAQGIRHVFMITGGGAMHLNDAIGRCKQLEYIPCHHEQACAIAAESYCRLTGEMAAVCVTTGPGGTNAITGVYGAWTDSIAMIVISGQVKWETLVRSTGLPLRQIGDQEVDIVRLVETITKYAVIVQEPSSIRMHLEKAIYLAKAGRPGPVWLDIPMNVQSALIDPDTLLPWIPEPDPGSPDPAAIDDCCEQIAARLRSAKRPVVLAGSGIRIAGAYEEFLRLVETWRVPVTTAFNAHDLLPHNHPLLVGRPGTIGDRAGNFAVQSADLLLVLGCRLNVRQTGYDFASFARAAFKIQVDIDAIEMQKPTVRIDLRVHADVRPLMQRLADLAPAEANSDHAGYLAWCRERRDRYPVVLPSYWDRSEPVNPYCFVDALFEALPPGQVVVTGDGTSCVATFQASRMKLGQRLFTNSGSAPMGFDLPAAVGASIATGRGQVVCIAGDGSIQMNLQELQTIATQRLPIKVFVFNNDGYHSIRQTQQAYFPDNPVGYSPATGVGVPNFEKLAAAYGISYFRIRRHEEMAGVIGACLGTEGAVMCEVMIDPEQAFAPKAASKRLEDGTMVSSPLEDMAPFLSAAEVAGNVVG